MVSPANEAVQRGTLRPLVQVAIAGGGAFESGFGRSSSRMTDTLNGLAAATALDFEAAAGRSYDCGPAPVGAVNHAILR